MYNEIELNKGEEKEIVRFRLPSRQCVELEKEVGKSVQEYLEDGSMTCVIKVLKYMRKWENNNFNDMDAEKLYDLLVENGYTLRKIIQDVIYETLVLCGFLERAEWEEMKKMTEEAAKRLKEERKKALANI